MVGENSLRSHCIRSGDPTVWEVDGGREFPKVPLYGKWLLEEKPLCSLCVVGGCVKEFSKFPLYEKWLLGEKPLRSNCVEGGCVREFSKIPLYGKCY
jgi:hypothetical protein